MPAKKRFAEETRKPLAGSHRPAFEGGTEAPLPGASRLNVSVFVRRKEPISPEVVGGAPITRPEYKRRHAADPAAIRAVQAFAREFGLDAAADPLRRTVTLTGSAKAMQAAFGVTLRQRTMPDGSKVRVREGEIMLPASLHPHVEAVLGLDTRPQASPHFRVARPNAVSASFTPVQIAQLYDFPSNSAEGQAVGLIELGGGFRTADISAYFKQLGLPAPAVTAVSVDGGKNAPGNASGADGEVMLDIEVAGAVAAGAKVAVYFAPNTDQGFLDAITTAVHDSANKPTVISISWGGPESSWTQQAMQAMDSACQSAAALGITVTAAAGDNGSDDGVGDGGTHVDFPASSPHVLACGGTKLVASGTSVSSETVWNETASGEGATGGGISTVFPQPA